MRYLLPAPVVEYIEEHKLYVDDVSCDEFDKRDKEKEGAKGAPEGEQERF